MTETEGVIKYALDYQPCPLPDGADLAGLFSWFAICREHALIGQDPARYEGYAYGNISVRAPTGFVISGTQTGGETSLGPDLLAWVQDFDIAANRLTAGGPARPSSEAMSHGQVYRALPDVGAVIHVHSPLIWRAAATLVLPTTPAEATYGTPEMAAAVERLLLTAANDSQGAFSMGGHEDGIIAYGSDIETAGGLLIDLHERAGAAAT